MSRVLDAFSGWLERQTACCAACWRSVPSAESKRLARCRRARAGRAAARQRSTCTRYRRSGVSMHDFRPTLIYGAGSDHSLAPSRASRGAGIYCRFRSGPAACASRFMRRTGQACVARSNDQPHSARSTRWAAASGCVLNHAVAAARRPADSCCRFRCRCSRCACDQCRRGSVARCASPDCRQHRSGARASAMRLPRSGAGRVPASREYTFAQCARALCCSAAAKSRRHVNCRCQRSFELPMIRASLRSHITLRNSLCRPG